MTLTLTPEHRGIFEPAECSRRVFGAPVPACFKHVPCERQGADIWGFLLQSVRDNQQWPKALRVADFLHELVVGDATQKHFRRIDVGQLILAGLLHEVDKELLLSKTEFDGAVRIINHRHPTSVESSALLAAILLSPAQHGAPYQKLLALHDFLEQQAIDKDNEKFVRCLVNQRLADGLRKGRVKDMPSIKELKKEVKELLGQHTE